MAQAANKNQDIFRRYVKTASKIRLLPPKIYWQPLSDRLIESLISKASRTDYILRFVHIANTIGFYIILLTSIYFYGCLMIRILIILKFQITERYIWKSAHRSDVKSQHVYVKMKPYSPSLIALFHNNTNIL